MNQDSLFDWLDWLEGRFGRARTRWIAILLLIGIASIAVRLLMHYDFHSTGLLYIGIPYLIALAIVIIKPVHPGEKLWRQYLDHSLTALVVFLASSVVLFEGFICVLFFMPIYFGVVSIAFLIHWLIRKIERQRGTTVVSLLPLLLIATSLEGTTPALSFGRDAHVVVTKVTAVPPSEVMRNLRQPFDLRKQRGRLLSVFPMPYEIEAGSLAPGDVHTVRTRYHRWFVTNTHEGELQLRIEEVTDNYVRTRFVRDTTFFASYLTPIGTEITLTELDSGGTEIELRIDYRRKLDPAWYFHPLQQYGVGQMASFLIDEVMLREQQ